MQAYQLALSRDRELQANAFEEALETTYVKLNITKLSHTGPPYIN